MLGDSEGSDEMQYYSTNLDSACESEGNGSDLDLREC